MARQRDGRARGVLGVATSRRTALTALGAGTAGLLAALGTRQQTGAAPPTVSAQAGSQPNIVLILTDDLDARSLEFMPHVAELLGREGTTFANAFATTPLCCPSRASILRGQYAHNHGVVGNAGKTGGFGAFYQYGRETSTVATWLQDAGYRTALAGKYFNNYPDESNPTYIPPGWDEWFGAADRTGKYFNYELNENGAQVWYRDGEADYSTAVLTAKATGFIRRAAAAVQPFFLYVSPNAPHGPATPAPLDAGAFPDVRAPRPPSFNEEDVSDKPPMLRDTPVLGDDQIARIDAVYRQRLRSLIAVDAMVAAVVAELEATAQLETTYVVFTSDNGYHLGEHRIGTAKRSPYEEAIRVPLLVRGPGVPAGRIEERLALNIDLAPTFAELAGAAAPDFVDGRSLVPLLQGKSAEWRQAAYIEGSSSSAAGSRARRSEDAETEESEGETAGSCAFRALRSPWQIYVEYATGERELYDLTEDPYQLTNLAGHADRGLLHDLSSQLMAMAGCDGSECRAIESTIP